MCSTKTGLSDCASGTRCSFRFLTERSISAWRMPVPAPGKRARRSGAEGKGQPSGQAPEARGETSKADIAAAWEKLISRGASDCDITNAMTPITGGCGPHCTVAADRPGHAREAHCGCRECHGGGRAPVTLPGWGQTPERVVATRPGQAPALA
jgi:hypothetical protein